MLAFSTSLMGSLPRSKELLALAKNKDANYKKCLHDETARAVKLQEEADIDIITSGELDRDNYLSFIATKISGLKMLSMSEILELSKDKNTFIKSLVELDVPSFAIKNAICVKKIAYKKSLIKDEILLLKKFTKRPIKATLPGIYLMSRSMWLNGISSKFYLDKAQLGADMIEILKREIDELCELGVGLIEFDEPILTEVVFAPFATRSFMCASLSAKKDIKSELEFALTLMKQIVNYTKQKGVKCGVHVCRGNWSKDENTLLTGSYAPLVELFEELGADILFLEFSTPRAGDIKAITQSKILSKNTILGLGVINPRSEICESKDEIIAKAKLALKSFSPKNLWLNPDCGFATFANRPLNSFEIIQKKLLQLQKARDELRAEFA
ncbi:MAG: cobalamin-independent methionine synthase II family protein [Campylobacter sp.]|nr:cobalamin-independent methionine synthase II family protein [Campylobacter sp.]